MSLYFVDQSASGLLFVDSNASLSGDITPPTYVEGIVFANGVTLTIELSEAVVSGGDGAGGIQLSSGHTGTYTSGAGTNILTYTLSTPLEQGASPTLAYTQPGDGLQDLSGNLLASFASIMTNNSTIIIDSTPPMYSVGDITAAGIEARILFNEAVTFGAAGASGFTISTGEVLTYTSGDGSTLLTYSIAPTVTQNEAPTLTYTQPGAGIADLAGNLLASFTSSIANNSTVQPPDVTPPVITVVGASPVDHVSGTSYVDAGATALDAVDGSVAVTTTNNVTHFIRATTVGYSATDAATNTSTATRVVNVNPPSGWVMQGTVNPDTTDAGSIYTGYTGDAPVTGDQVVFEGATTPDGHNITVAGNGFITLQGVPTATQTFDRYVIQADGTIGVTATYTYLVGPGDVTPPVLSSPTATPNANPADYDKATGTITTDEGNGTLYYMASNNATATAALVVSVGATQAVTSTGSQSVAVTGLIPTTNYYMHYVHVDAAGNASDSVSSPQFTTIAAPIPIMDSPVATTTGPETATGTINTDTANGTLFYLVSASSIGFSAAEIIAHADTLTQPVTATGQQTVLVTGLTAGTRRIFFTHRSSAGLSGANYNSNYFTNTGVGGTTPAIIGATTHTQPEYSAFAYDYTVTNRAGQLPTLGGADIAHFSWDAQGGDVFRLSMAAKDYETPVDAGGNNVYEATITINDLVNPQVSQAVTVTVTNVYENVTGQPAPLTMVSNTGVPQNDPTLLAWLATATGATANNLTATDPIPTGTVHTVTFTQPDAADVSAVLSIAAGLPTVTPPLANQQYATGAAIAPLDVSTGIVGANSIVITGLPDGLVASGAGVITGTTTGVNAYHLVSVAATNAVGTSTFAFTIAVGLGGTLVGCSGSGGAIRGIVHPSTRQFVFK